MDLATNNPQKVWVKKICQALFYLGLGKCWYEGKHQSDLKKLSYPIWIVVSNAYFFLITANVLLTNFRMDLDEKEQNDSVQFSIAFGVISAKILLFYWKKDSILEVLQRILEGFRSAIVVEKFDNAIVRKSKRISMTILGGTYATMLVTTFVGIRAHLLEGVPIRTEVTYYPSKSDSGLGVNILRFFIQFHWWFAVSIMVGIDSLCISSLVIVGYKFKVLQVYFTSLRDKLLENLKTKTRSESEKEFINDFVTGIKMHDDALWCAAHVQSALGSLYSVQIFESVLLILMCLVKLVTVDRNLIFLLANVAYISCLILLTGAYMMPAGDITHEASMVSISMFHSGWELVTSREMRVLAVLALQRSQAPVIMTAFGILTLSYSNFISVIRSSYSFFAVMY